MAASDPTPAAAVAPDAAAKVPTWVWAVPSTLALVALALAASLWQRLSSIQESLARQTADSAAQAIEGRTLARQAMDQVRDSAGRLALAESKLAESTLQRGQLEELMQSLSRSRDENLLVDIEAGLRLAQQQAQLTGSLEPLVAALKSADQRISRAAQPRLALVQRAVLRDLERVRATRVTDVPQLLQRLDEMVRLVDEMPLANAVGAAPEAKGTDGARARGGPDPAASAVSADWQQWWQRWWSAVRSEATQLVRLSRIDQPDAALLSPEQSFFVRENIKLKLLNARLGLLARQNDSARSDLLAARAAVQRYFDVGARKTALWQQAMEEASAQAQSGAIPGLDDSLTALAAAAAGR